MINVVTGFSGITYTLDELKFLCPKFYTRKDYNSNQELKNELLKRKAYHSKIYNNREISIFPGEIWKDLTEIKDFANYSVSTYGRIKYNGSIILQDDEKDKYGYLILPHECNKNMSYNVHVYTMVAYAFLGKLPYDGKHVHHIDNNGYNCRADNLIVLDSEQHSYVHGKIHHTQAHNSLP